MTCKLFNDNNFYTYSYSYSVPAWSNSDVRAEANSFGLYKVSVELIAQFKQAFSDGWSKSTGKTNSKTTGSDASVTLSPYTNVLIKQGEATTTVTTRYNCPVIVGCKVTVIVRRLF